MNDLVKKTIFPTKNYYIDFAKRLEGYSQEGLIFEKAEGKSLFFHKSIPQNLKYTITFLDSLHSLHPKFRQLTYLEYAKFLGWSLVYEFDCVQIFSGLPETPPLEVDNQEMLSNIHQHMKKTYINREIDVLLGFIISVFINYNYSDYSFYTITTYQKFIVFPFVIFIASFLVNSIFRLIHYRLWFSKSKKSVSSRGQILVFSDKYYECAKTLFYTLTITSGLISLGVFLNVLI